MTFERCTSRSALRNMRHILKEPDQGCGQKTLTSPTDELWRIDWKKRGYPFCGIYIITPDSLQPSKIGVSVSPGKRLISLQTSHWRLLQISEYRWAANAQDALLVEQEAHRILRANDKALLGEWFDVRAKAAIEAVEWAALSLGIEVRKDAPDEGIRLQIEDWHRQIERREHDVNYDNMRQSLDRPALGFADADRGKYGSGHLFFQQKALDQEDRP